MEWFIAKLVYQIQSGNGNHQPQFDEQLRLIQAEDFSGALFKAKEVGIEQQLSFFNINKELVKWQFIDVVALDKIEMIEDKSELHSEIKEIANVTDYIDELKIRARLVRRQQVMSYEL